MSKVRSLVPALSSRKKEICKSVYGENTEPLNRLTTHL